MLKDWETYSSEGRPFYDPTSIRPEVLLTSDPPVHTRVRASIQRVLSGPAMRKMGEDFRGRGGRAGGGAARGRPGRARRLQGPLGAVRPAGVPGHDRDAPGGPPLPHGVRRCGLPGLRAAQRAVGEGRARGRRGDRLRRALLPARRAGAGRDRSGDLRVGRRRGDHRARGRAARQDPVLGRLGHDDLLDHEPAEGDGGVPRPVGPAARGPVARPRGVRGEPALPEPRPDRRAHDDPRDRAGRRAPAGRGARARPAAAREPGPTPMGGPGPLRHHPQERGARRPRLRHPRLRRAGGRADRGRVPGHRARPPRRAHRAARRRRCTSSTRASTPSTVCRSD